MSNLNWVLKKIEGDELIEIRRKEDGLLIADAYGIGYARLIAAAPAGYVAQKPKYPTEATI